MNRCAGCGGGLPPAQGRGRPRRYCSDQCRKAAFRARDQRAALFDVPSDQAKTIADVTRGAPLPPELAALMPAGEPSEQLAEHLVLLACTAGTLRALSDHLPPQLGYRAERLGNAVAEALAEHFPDVL